MALPSFMQHLRVLERGGLVRSKKVGRVRTYEISPQPMQHAAQWLTAQRAVWERRLDQFDDYARSLQPKADKR